MRGKGQTTSTDARSGWLRRLSRACWRYPRNLMLALAGTLVVSLVGIAIPLIQRAIVDNLTSAAQAAIWPLAVALLVAAVANFAGLYVRRYRGGQLSLDVQHDLRTQLFSALSRLDGTRQDELHTGQIVSRSISDLTMIQSLLSMVPMLMGNAVLFVGSLIAMAFLSPLLTLVALAVGPALWFIARGLPAHPVPGQLGRAAAGGRDRRGGRRGRDRGAGGEGLRAGGAGGPADRAGQHPAVRLPGPGGAADSPLQPGAAGHPGAGPGGGARARRLARPARHDQPGHVPGLLLLPRGAGLAGPVAGRPGHHRPAGPGQRDPGVRGHRRAAGRHRPARCAPAAAPASRTWSWTT